MLEQLLPPDSHGLRQGGLGAAASGSKIGGRRTSVTANALQVHCESDCEGLPSRTDADRMKAAAAGSSASIFRQARLTGRPGRQVTEGLGMLLCG
jgi:hypothetical protein